MIVIVVSSLGRSNLHGFCMLITVYRVYCHNTKDNQSALVTTSIADSNLSSVVIVVVVVVWLFSKQGQTKCIKFLVVAHR